MKKLIITLLTLTLASQIFANQMRISKRDNSRVNYERKQKAAGNVFQQIHKRFEQEKITVRKNAALSVFNENGKVQIIGWDNDYMLVESKIVSFGNRNDLNSAELSITEMGGYVIETKLPSKVNVEVHLKIYVPKDMILDKIETADGTASIKKLDKSNFLNTEFSKR